MGTSSTIRILVSMLVFRIIQLSVWLMLGLSGAWWGFAMSVSAHSPIPAVSSIDLSEREVQPGAVVSFREDEDTYQYSTADDGTEVYGVVSVRPPLYLETATTAVPVILDGVGSLQVVDSNGSVERGDLLRVSATQGAAERSTDPDDFVFAVALESATVGTDLILADISPVRAQAAQERWTVANAEITKEERLSAGAIAATSARILVALGIVVGSLVFVLFTYRSIWVTGVTAVGRNPRARRAVLLMNVASTILLLLLAIFVVIVALGVLVVSV